MVEQNKGDKERSISSAAIKSVPPRMWIAALLIALPSFQFGYIIAALNSCLVTVSPLNMQL
jgi:hypothetical protein